MTNTNTLIGRKSEETFRDVILENPEIIKEIIASFGKRISKSTRVKHIFLEGEHKEKSDVFIRATGGNNFGVNIKSFKGRGFNQVIRMSIDMFVMHFSFPAEFESILVKLTLDKASTRLIKWIPENQSEYIIKVIKPKAYEIISNGLIGTDHPKLFVLIEYYNKEIRIYKMEDVLAFIKNNIDVSITKKGVISLHSCFTIQKKGGNGNRVKYLKTDIRHGGNNIQLKMKSKLFMDETTDLVLNTLKY